MTIDKICRFKTKSAVEKHSSWIQRTTTI